MRIEIFSYRAMQWFKKDVFVAGLNSPEIAIQDFRLYPALIQL